MWFWLFISSFLINIFLGFYIRWLLKEVVYIHERASDASILVKRYKNHIETLHELEMFYGDNTLRALMEHSTELIENLKELDFLLNEESEESEEESQTTAQETLK